MTKSQNTKNEQQKDLCITSEQLTEQWKKGELPEGHYYVKDGEILIAEYLDGYFYNNGEPMTSFSGGVDEVLAPVPSYDEWKQLKEYERIVTSYNMKPIDYDIACETVIKLLDDNKRLKHDVGNLGYKIKNQRHEIDNRLKEIEKLKELLKECKTPLKVYNEMFGNKEELLTKIDEVLR